MEAKAKANPNHLRAVVPINHTLDKHLTAYMTVAAATGVGIFALAQPSEAEIVYTATHQSLNVSGAVNVDFNNDGVTDLFFVQVPVGYGVDLYAYASKNHFMSASRAASALPWGKRIGPTASFNRRIVFLDGANYHSQGCQSYASQWHNKFGYYLGVQFSIGTETHYGWVRLSIGGKCTNGIAELTGYAYETIPNKPIIAGKTSGFAAADTHADHVLPAPSQWPSLGMLALGTDGLTIWRREEEAA